ncbi:MAG TPA: hypothetical protein VHU19_17550 [Pyrinomonadaceae bacterium]|jgi:hypothetical protein|nr:hypothetical protein [Pyrinomonadaceae bacterium]
MKLLIAIFCIISLTTAALAQTSATPRFEDYNAPVYKGRPAPVTLNGSKEARNFRTQLREGAKQGVNFAGHYTLVSWGCGTACLQVALIDAKTGAVFFPGELDGFGVWFWDNNDEALRFKPNSRLLVMSGFPASQGNKDEPKSGLYYYEWTGSGLKLIRFVEKRREQGR